MRTPQKDIKIPQVLTIFPHETWWDCYTLYVQWQAVVCQSPLPTYKSEIQLDESIWYEWLTASAKTLAVRRQGISNNTRCQQRCRYVLQSTIGIWDAKGPSIGISVIWPSLPAAYTADSPKTTGCRFHCHFIGGDNVYRPNFAHPSIL